MIFGKFGDMLQQAKKIKDELARARYEAEHGGVRVTVSGEMEILELKISPEVSSAKLEGVVKEAVNRALQSAKSEMLKKLPQLAGGLNIPGMP